MFFHILKLTVFLGFGLCAVTFVLWFLWCLLLAALTVANEGERDYSVGRDAK